MGMPTSSIVEVQHSSNQSQTSSVTVTLGATPTEGNLLVAYVSSRFAITTPSGWSEAQVSSTGHYAKLLYKFAGGSESTAIAISSTSATAMVAGVAEFSGPTSFGASGVATSSAQWYAPAGTISPTTSSLVVAVQSFGFKSCTVLPWDSGNKTLPTPGSWSAGLKPSTTAHSSGLQGVGRPFVMVTGSGYRNALAAHFGIITASYGGSQSVQYLHDWWLEPATSPGVSNNTMILLMAEFKTSVDYSSTPADAEGVSDSITTIVGTVRAQSDSAGVTDSATFVASYSRLPSDAEGVTDSVTVVSTTDRVVADAAGVTDSVVAELTGSLDRTVADSLGLTDEVTTAYSFVRSVDSPVGIAGLAVESAERDRAGADSEGVTDLVTLIQSLSRTSSESTGVSDTVHAVLNEAAIAAMMYDGTYWIPVTTSTYSGTDWVDTDLSGS